MKSVEKIKYYNTPEYWAYREARSRCLNKRHPNYRNYGQRGIKFLFENFNQFLIEIGKRPSKIYSLDRINNDGHYEIGNVRWATKSEQRRNMRDSKFNPAKVKEVRSIYQNGIATQKELAEMYNTTQPVISRILSGERWGDIK